MRRDKSLLVVFEKNPFLVDVDSDVLRMHVAVVAPAEADRVI